MPVKVENMPRGVAGTSHRSAAHCSCCARCRAQDGWSSSPSSSQGTCYACSHMSTQLAPTQSPVHPQTLHTVLLHRTLARILIAYQQHTHMLMPKRFEEEVALCWSVKVIRGVLQEKTDLICAHVSAILLHLCEVGLEEGKGLSQEPPHHDVHRCLPRIGGEDLVFVDTCPQHDLVQLSGTLCSSRASSVPHVYTWRFIMWLAQSLNPHQACRGTP